MFSRSDPLPRMFNLLHRAFILLIVFAFARSTQGQNSANGAWQQLAVPPQTRPAAEVWIRPAVFKAFSLDHERLGAVLSRAATEKVQRVSLSQAIISLPMPDGSLARFRFVESPIMAPALAAKFPEIKTYLGQGIDDPLATVRFDLTPAGLHAQILSPQGAVYIDPYFRGNAQVHASYYKRDLPRSAEDFLCLTDSSGPAAFGSAIPGPLTVSGANLRTYRLACAATAEYTQFHGGTVAQAMAAIVTAINRVSGVYETELAIRLELVSNNDLIIYTSSNMDPYSNGSGSTMLNQNQANLDSVIGSGNYDIGHVFSTGGGGIAGLGVVCVNGRKANGVTGLSAPTGDAFYIDYVAHEMGHQFGANHTFNSVSGSCGGGNRNGATAYEPGSGSTIMAYAGICGSDDLQPHSDPYFHSVSLDEIIQFTTASSGSFCPVSSPTGNNAPTVNAGQSFNIPRSTPFALTAFGTDPDGDTLTFCWEERDLGSSTTLAAADNGFSPLFRSFNPTTGSSRTFPKLADILSNSISAGEKLPNTTRTLNFRVVSRDNQAGGGGIHTANMQVSVSSNSGPFVVTSPNTAVTWSNVQTITWNVAGTTGSPVNATTVDILLSTNGGLAFPIVLATNVPNNGAQSVLLPNLTTAEARVKVQGSGNIFFDISDANFSIIKSVPAPLILVESAVLDAESCVNGAIDPGETVTVNFVLKNVGTTNTTNLVVTMLSSNGLTVQSSPQYIGVLPAGAAVSVPLSFAPSGACGGTIQAALNLQDGIASLGTLMQSFALGNVAIATTTWNNSGSISIPAPGDTRGPGGPYPSSVVVSGVTGTVSKVTVTLHGLSHGASDDVDILLVGPNGQNALLMSDAGNGGPINNLTLTFDDSAAGQLPSAGSISTGTYKPTNIDNNSDNFGAPAPSAPYGQSLSTFNDINPNGEWSLYVQDDFKQNTGSLVQGWSLTVTTSNTTCCISVPATADLAISGSVIPDLVNVGSNLVYSLRITNLGPQSASSVTVTDALPTGVSFVSALASQGTYTVDGALVSFALGPLASGASANLQVMGKADSAGTTTNRAWVSTISSDPIANNNFLSLIAAANGIVNQPPELAPIADRIVHAGSMLSLTNAASDPDVPTNTLSFSLLPEMPTGASITAEGIFNWATSDADANTTNSITVRVTDDGVPNLSDEQSFVVTVIGRPIIESITTSNGLVSITWGAIIGQRYEVQFQEELGDTNWTGLPPAVTAEGASATKVDNVNSGNQRFYRIMVNP